MLSFKSIDMVFALLQARAAWRTHCSARSKPCLISFDCIAFSFRPSFDSISGAVPPRRECSTETRHPNSSPARPRPSFAAAQVQEKLKFHVIFLARLV
jgi:hypothetical protein